MNLVKKLRAETGLSLRELAKEAGVGQDTISQVENDRTKAQILTLGKLAKTFTQLLGRPITLEMFEDLLDTTASERGRKGGTPSHKHGALIFAEGAATIIPVPVPASLADTATVEAPAAGAEKQRKARAANDPSHSLTPEEKLNAGNIARALDVNFGQVKNAMLRMPDRNLPYNELLAIMEARFKKKG